MCIKLHDCRNSAETPESLVCFGRPCLGSAEIKQYLQVFMVGFFFFNILMIIKSDN